MLARPDIARLADDHFMDFALPFADQPGSGFEGCSLRHYHGTALTQVRRQPSNSSPRSFAQPTQLFVLEPVRHAADQHVYADPRCRCDAEALAPSLAKRLKGQSLEIIDGASEPFATRHDLRAFPKSTAARPCPSALSAGPARAWPSPFLTGTPARCGVASPFAFVVPEATHHFCAEAL
jgi:hypothetical protein